MIEGIRKDNKPVSLYLAMLKMGYKQIVAHTEYQFADMEIASSTKCPKCGGDMYYEGYECGNSYRAFSVCIKCTHYEEF